MLIVQPVSKTHHLAVPVDDAQRIVLHARHDHVEAVGTEVDGGDDPFLRVIFRVIVCVTVQGLLT